MTTILNISKPINQATYNYQFTICTLVTRLQEYEEMLQSFIDKGFDTQTCEYLYIDNSNQCTFDAYKGLNLFLQQAKGKYIIICHQDIVLHDDDIKHLLNKIKEVEKVDINWAILGNAGAVGPNHIVYHVTYPNNVFMSKGKFPLKVCSIDENFILVKNGTFLSVSNNLTGFHLYATDLCLQAQLKGYNSYAIAFNLTHKSRGNKNQDFFLQRKKIIKKYSHFFRNRWIQTNSTVFYIAGSFFGRMLGNPISLFFVRMLNGLNKRIK